MIRPPRVGEARLLVLMALGGLLFLPPLLGLSLVDQIWVPGIYDEADRDDVVLVATSTLSTLDLPTLALLPASLISRQEDPRRAPAAASAFATRAPPTT